MTSRSSQTRLFRELEARYGTKVAEAFLEAIADIRSRVQVGQIIESLERGDVEGAFEALNLDAAAYDQMLEQIRAAYQDGGRAAADALPRRRPDGTALVFRFDGRNPVAEGWLARHSSNLITRVVEDQRAAVRVALTESLAQGANPRTAALRVVGRISRATGRREGGILGLTAAQERAVASARSQLLSGDRSALRAYLTRGKRDRRFDRSVARVIRDGGRLNPEAVERAVQSYSNRLLKLRADTIARTETLTSLNAASHEAARQLVESGKVTDAQVRRVWRSAADNRVRDTHRALNAESVGLEEAFVSPSGARLRFPGDTSLGAPASEIINCFAPLTEVSGCGLQGGISRHYSGDLVELTAGRDVYLSVTPNHPILTQRGWVAAGDLVESDQLVNAAFRNDVVASWEPHIGYAKASAEQLYSAAKSLGCVNRASRSVVNLHGEVPSQDVDVVALPRGLRDAMNSASRKAFGNLSLAETDIDKGPLLLGRLLGKGADVGPHSPRSAMRCLGTSLTDSGGSESGRAPVALRNVGPGETNVGEAGIDHCPADADLSGDRKDGQASLEQSAHFGEVWLPGSRISSGGGRALPEVARVRDKAKVSVALLDHIVRQAQPAGDLVDVMPGSMLDLDVGVVHRPAHSESFGGALAAVTHDPGLADHVIGEVVAHSSGLSGRAHGHARAIARKHVPGGEFTLARITKIEKRHYEGPVYNFETANALIVAGNVITHNCRCVVENRIDFLANLR